MCTVSYIPNKNGFVVTSNRDENPLRITKSPKKITLANDRVVTAPIDALEGGTWIAMDENGRVACLLNGAFQKHIRQTKYRRSRGHFIIEAFEATNFEDYAASVFLDNIEPFTLLLFESNRIQKLIWDGKKKYIWELSSDAVHLWSSSTLYSSENHAEKEHYFIKCLEAKGLNENNILQIHGKDYDTPFIINHCNVKTVSITQLVNDGENASLLYILKKQHDEKFVHSFFAPM